MQGDRDASLAGLGYSFDPVQFKARQAKAGLATNTKSTCQSVQATKSVLFNLKQRRPGPAYSSPQGPKGKGASSRPQSAGEQHKPSKQNPLRRSCPTTPTFKDAESPVHKGQLASLQPSTRTAKLVKLKEAALARRRSSADEVPQTPHQQVDEEVHQTLTFDALPDDLGEEDLALLHRTEKLLAGCTAGVTGIPVKLTSPRQLQLFQMPVRPGSNEQLDGKENCNELFRNLKLSHTAQKDTSTVQDSFEGGSILGQSPCDQHSVDVLRDVPAIEDVHAILSTITYPASPCANSAQDCRVQQTWDTCEQTALVPKSEQQQQVLVDAAPGTLREALCMLGLASGDEAWQDCLQRKAIYMSPVWLKLRAAAVVTATKDHAAQQELQPLMARLRQVHANLEFHRFNASRHQGRTPPKRQTTGLERPWLSGNSSAVNSKHKRARSISPGRQLPPRPKVAPASKASSELQVKLLSELEPKLWMKLCLLALRHAAAVARLQEQLLVQVQLTKAGKQCIGLIRAWKAASIPASEMFASADSFHASRQQHRMKQMVLAWREWAPQSRLQTDKVHQCLHTYHQHLEKAALVHWKAFCQQRLVARLQRALASRWVTAWYKRKVFGMWRILARRAVLQKDAMQARIARAGRIGNQTGGVEAAAHRTPPRQAPTYKQSLEASRAAFRAVKDFVGAARQELRDMQADMRFCVTSHNCQQGSVVLPTSPARPDPAPVGSLAELLELLQPPPLQHPALAQTSAQARPFLLEAPSAQRRQPDQQPRGAPWQHGIHSPAHPRHESVSGVVPTSAPHSPAMRGWSGINMGSPGTDPLHPEGFVHAEHQSPTSAYDPARYASPVKHSSRRQLGVIHAEMDGHLAAVGHIQEELDNLEKEAEELKQQREDYERQRAEAEQEAAECAQKSKGAQQAKQEASDALQVAIDRHTQASLQCTSIELQLQQHQELFHRASSSAAGTKGAVNATLEQQALVAISMQKWTKQVEAAAKEMARCHRSQQPAAAARLKEARLQLEQQQEEADCLQSRVAEQQQRAEEATKQAAQAEQAVKTVSAQLISATQERQQLQQDIKRFMQAQERHAVEAVSQQQACSAAAHRQRMLCAHIQHSVQRLQSIAAQVLVKQQDAEQLQQRVCELERLARAAAAEALQSSRSAAVTATPGARVARPAATPDDTVELYGSASPLMKKARSFPPESVEKLGPEEQDREGSAASSPLHARRSMQVGWCAKMEAFAEPSNCQAVGISGSQWSEGSELSVVAPSSRPSSPRPHTVEELADLMYHTCLLGHAFRTLRQLALCRRALEASAEQHFAGRVLTRCLHDWRAAAADTTTWLADVQPVLWRRGVLRRWSSWVKARQRLQSLQEQLHAEYCRRLLVRGFLGLRARVDHQQWRDAVHVEVVRLRWRNMLRGWRCWTKKQRVEAALLQRGCAVYEKRLCAEAWRQWAWLARNKALLRRVFQTAAALWREEVGVLLHTRNFQAIRAAFDTWQLHVLELQELRRQQILWNAAAAFREKQLLLAGLQGFGRQVQAAREHQRMLLLCAEMIVEWRRLSQTSPRHWDLLLADNQRRKALLRASIAGWREAAEGAAHLLARFWLRWQVHAPLRRAFIIWRALAKWQKRQAQQDALASAFRRVVVLRNAFVCWRRALPVLRERRILTAMADSHRGRTLALRVLHAWLAVPKARMSHRSSSHAFPPAGTQQHHPCMSPNAGTRGYVSPRIRPSDGLMPCVPQQAKQSSHQPDGLHTVVIVPGARRVVVQHRHHPAREQHLSRKHSGCNETCAPGAPHLSPARPQVVEMLQAVDEWKGAAEYWRQRLAQPRSSPMTARGK